MTNEQRMRAALADLRKECSLAGFDDARDFRWPVVLKNADAALAAPVDAEQAKPLTDDEIMAKYDAANTPTVVTTAHAEWHKKVLLRFARSLLKTPQIESAETVFDEQAERNRHDSEELEALHMCLDEVGAPKDVNGLRLSAWGRVSRIPTVIGSTKDTKPVAWQRMNSGMIELTAYPAQADVWRHKGNQVEPLYATPQPQPAIPAAPEQKPGREYLQSLLEGMTVSLDVSTGDHDAGNRYFGAINEVMEDSASKHGVTLLVYDAEPNFSIAQQAAPDQAALTSASDMLELAQKCGARLSGKPDGSEPIEVIFSVRAWRIFVKTFQEPVEYQCRWAESIANDTWFAWGSMTKDNFDKLIAQIKRGDQPTAQVRMLYAAPFAQQAAPKQVTIPAGWRPEVYTALSAALDAAAPSPQQRDESKDAWIGSDDLADLMRFQECCEDPDSGGHDVPKERMRRLAEIGVVWPTGFGKHQITTFGDFVIAKHFEQSYKLPLQTTEDYNRAAAIAQERTS